MSQLAGQQFDPANWKEHYAAVRRRITGAGVQRQVNIEAMLAIASQQAQQAAEEMRMRAQSQLEWKNAARILLRMELRRSLAIQPTRVASMFGNRKIVDSIIRQVSEASGVAIIDLLSSRRTYGIVRPRQFAMYRAKTETTLSLPMIGRLFGGKDHTTVLHAVRKIESLLAQNLIPQDLLKTLPTEPTP